MTLSKKPSTKTTAVNVLLLACSFILFTSCLDSINTGPFLSGGSGTESDPYRISTIEQLQAIDQEKYLDKHFIQVNDIDASETENYQRGSGFKFIGDPERPFTGTYNGNGYKITDLRLHIQRSGYDHTGIFWYVKGGLIKNVTIENSPRSPAKLQELQHAYKSVDFRVGNLAAKESDFLNRRGIGGLVGFNDGGVVSNCRFIGNVGGYISHSVGGLVGINTGLIEDSYFEGKVSGGGASGFAYLNVGEIKNSGFTGSLSGMSAYGLVAVNYGEIYQSYSQVKQWGSHGSTGLVGTNEGGVIQSSFSAGEVNGNSRSAGFVLRNNGTISNSYSRVNIEMVEPAYEVVKLGGFVYKNEEDGIIENSFSAGTIMLEYDPDGLGAVAEENLGVFSSVYWNSDKTGTHEGVNLGNSVGISNLTTTQITGSAAETHMPEFDWVNVWRTTDGYPVLRWQEGE